MPKVAHCHSKFEKSHWTSTFFVCRHCVLPISVGGSIRKWQFFFPSLPPFWSCPKAYYMEYAFCLRHVCLSMQIRFGTSCGVDWRHNVLKRGGNAGRINWEGEEVTEHPWGSENQTKKKSVSRLGINVLISFSWLVSLCLIKLFVELLSGELDHSHRTKVM